MLDTSSALQTSRNIDDSLDLDIYDSNDGNEVMGTSLYASILSLLAIDAKYLLNLSEIALLQTICLLSIIKDALISCFPLLLISFIIFQVFSYCL